MTITLGQAIDSFGVEVLEYLDREVLIPVIDDIGAQGDVLIVAKPSRQKCATTPLPKDGFPAVRGESGGNTHLLLAEGAVFYDAETPTPTKLDLGTLTVGEGATCYLAHPEHAYLGIAPGNYTLRRQREQSDVIRIVQD